MQQGQGGLTTILNQDTYKQINFRPAAVNRLDNNVGERGVGISRLRNGNMVPVASNQRFTRDDKRFFGKPISNTARLGQQLQSVNGKPMVGKATPQSLAGRQGNSAMLGGADVSPELQARMDERKAQEQAALQGAIDAAGGVKQKRKKKFKNLGPLGKVKRVAGDAIDFVKKHKVISTVGNAVGTIAPLVGHPEIGAIGKTVGTTAGQLGFGSGRVQMAKEELKGTSAGPAGMDKQMFVPTHPMNFNKARLATM